jgi:hypothetical protein
MVLLNESATKGNIKDAITDWLAPNESEDSIVLIQYSGPGISEPALKVYDATINATEFDSMLDELESENVAVIIDSCFSGGMFQGVSLPPGLTPRYSSSDAGGKGDFVKSIEGDGRVVLAACNTSELAFESSDLENGVFTYFLLESFTNVSADTNLNGWVSVEEAFNNSTPS